MTEEEMPSSLVRISFKSWITIKKFTKITLKKQSFQYKVRELRAIMAVYLTTIIGDQYQLDKENCTNSSLNSIVGSGSVVVGSRSIVIDPLLWDPSSSDPLIHQRQSEYKDKDKKNILQTPNVCYMFEKQGVQVYQIWHSHQKLSAQNFPQISHPSKFPNFPPV